jgi:hypothetical protein
MRKKGCPEIGQEHIEKGHPRNNRKVIARPSKD